MGILTLKKLQLNETMSEETACFSADLYDDGILVAYVSNRGHGGSNDFYPVKGKTYSDIAKYDNIDTECEILTMVEELNKIKKYQRNCMVLKKDNKIYTQRYSLSFAKAKQTIGYKDWLAKQIKQFNELGYEVLNTNL